MHRRAAIVGGGIAGLATAIALRNAGWSVRVYEQAPAFTEVGAGISLWPNALRALDHLGLGAPVRSTALRDTSGGIRDPAGRWLNRSDTGAVERRYGSVSMLHRADLLDALLAALPDSVLRSGTTVEHVDLDGTVRSVGEAGDSRLYDLVVGADGLHSLVRTTVAPQAPAPRYAGYTAWRFVTEPLAEPLREGAEVWGRGARFGYAPMTGDRVYCFAVHSARPGGTSLDLSSFASWAAPVRYLLDQPSQGAVVRHDIYDLPDPGRYVRGRVALVGDAAHAMTPNLGQGACTALEDAVTLASCAPDLQAYDRSRRPRTQRIVRQSRRIGAVAQWSFPAAAGARNALLRAVPAPAMMRSMRSVLDWHPPHAAD